MPEYFPKLYLDECVHAQAAKAFRDVGFDAVGVHEEAAFALDDRTQLEVATSAGRAFVTYNVGDFVQIHDEWSHAGQAHCGILLVPTDYKKSLGALVRDVRETLREDGRHRGGSGGWERNELIWVRRYGGI